MRKLFSKTTFLIAMLAVMASSGLQAQLPTDRSLYMDGTDDYIFLLNTANLQASDITIEAWIKICDIKETNTIASKAYCLANRYAYHFYVTDGKLAWQHYDNGDCSDPDNQNILKTVNAVVSEGVWHHVAVTHNSVTEEVVLYVDGTAYNAGDPTETDFVGVPGHPLASVTEPIRIGLLRPGSGNAVGTFHGNIDEVMIWDEVRSGTDINGDMDASTPPVNASNLLVFLKMNAPIMGRDELVVNSYSSGSYSGLTKDYNNIFRPDQTPFSIYNDTEICCNSGVTSRMAAPEPAEEAAPIETLVISPNPNQGTFKLYWEGHKGEIGQVEIRDLVTGQLVYTGHVSSGQEIDLGERATGTLSVTVLTESGSFITGKLISSMK